MVQSKSPDGREWGSYYDSKLRSYMARNAHITERQERNWKMFSGVNWGQWNNEQLQQLIDEKRPPHQINFLQHKILTLLGNYLQDPFEAAFEAESKGQNNDSLLLNKLRAADANRGKWDKEKGLFFRAGLIFRGVMEMYKDYRHDPLGNIGIRYWNPFRVQFDPNWDSDNINDNNEILLYTWMDPTEISRVYNKKTEEIETAIRLWKANLSNPAQEEKKDEIADDSPEFYNQINGKFLVIQGMRMEYETIQKIYDSTNNTFLQDMDPENARAILSIRGSELKVIKEQVGVCKVITTCPGLLYSLILENGNHPIQIGRYPIFTWSSLNLHGEVQGAVDVLKDFQEIVNKHISTYTHWQNTATNGTEFIEEDFFATGEFDRYCNGANIPGSKFKVNPGKLTSERGGLQVKERGNPPTDLPVMADKILSLGDEVSATPPSITGGEGKSGESGRLFQAKRQQALVALEPMSKSIEDKEGEILEAYFRAVKQVYRRVPRTIIGGNEPIYINVPMVNGEIYNDIDRIQRQNIIVTRSRKGASVMREMANNYIDALQIIRNPVLQSFIEMQLIGTLPNIPDADIEEAKRIAKIFLDLQVARGQAELSQIRQAIMQTAQMQSGMMQGGMAPGGMLPQIGTSPPGKTPMEGGGLSVEGKEINPQGGVPVDMRMINQLK